MSQTLAQTQIDHWQRYFAVECNNQAWALADQARRTPSEDAEMLAAAYAAAYHWTKIGTPVNGGRADVTLAHVHAILGNGGEALHHAQSALDFFQTGEGEDWDLAFAHAVMARSAAVMGDRDLHGVHYAAAQSTGGAIVDEADRAIFLAALGKVPSEVH